MMKGAYAWRNVVRLFLRVFSHFWWALNHHHSSIDSPHTTFSKIEQKILQEYDKV
jgi:hypothetical protein